MESPLAKDVKAEQPGILLPLTLLKGLFSFTLKRGSYHIHTDG